MPNYPPFQVLRGGGKRHNFTLIKINNMTTSIFKGTYGSGKTPCFVFTCQDFNGGTWYAVEGSVNVNYTYDDITDGVNVEELSDYDFFTASEPIESKSILKEQVEDFINN